MRNLKILILFRILKFSVDRKPTMGTDDWAEEMEQEEPLAFRPIFVCSKDVECKFALSRGGRQSLPTEEVDDREQLVAPGDEITRGERFRVLNLLAKYADVFQRPPGARIPSELDPYEIDTGIERPVCQRGASCPIHLRPLIQAEIECLLKTGIIRRSNSQWQSRWLLVPRPDGRYRCCLVARALNKKTRQLGGHLPLINDLLDSRQG